MGGLDRIVDQLDRLDDLRMELELARLHLSQVQQLARNVEQTVAAFLDAAYELLLLVIERAQPGVAQQLETHQNRRDRGLHLVRYGGNEIGFGRIQLLVFRHVVQNDQIPDEIPLLLPDGIGVKRNIVHLEIALLIVRIDFQRLVRPVGFPVRVQFPDQTTQQVVVYRDLGGVAPDYVSPFEIQYRERLVVHKKDVPFGIQPDDRLVKAVDDRLDTHLFGHQPVERAAPVLGELLRHIVERFGDTPQLAVIAEVEPLVVIMVGDLDDSLLQLVDGAEHDGGEIKQEQSRQQDTKYRYDRYPAHRLVRAALHPPAFGQNGTHIQLHDAVQVIAYLLDLFSGNGIVEPADLLFEGGGDLTLVDLRDILLLQGQSLDQRPAGGRILREAVQGAEHLAHIMYGVVVIRQNLFRGDRQMAHVPDRLYALYEDQGEQDAYAQTEFAAKFHITITWLDLYSFSPDD